MFRKFGKEGRISIPKEMRDKLGFKEKEEVKIEIVGNKIIITKTNEFNIQKYIRDNLEKYMFEEDKTKSKEYIKGAKDTLLDVLAKIENGEI